MPTTEAQLIEKFYTAFSKKDAVTMTSLYAHNVVFEDPAFGQLKGREAVAMWTMLLSRSKDIHITFSDISADTQTGKAKWVATYTFTKTGRVVVNKVNASFEFADGKITRHTDSFDMNAWLKMAFGWKGNLFAYIPFLKNKFKQTVKKTLLDYMAKHS
ncbi:MAG: nuclear transport factor 2 family protein [Cytophagia bacterium]|nr:nuclear transport factor 2 family protein [Cytophagia bacterium]NBW35753.1 nuclear transport factor 2 family protein [Cytophagia bacterium]